MNLLVVGAGATGGYFGGRLIEAGRDVTFLVRAGRASQLASEGLVIKSPNGDAKLAPKVLTADRLNGHFDIVLLTVKSFFLDQSIKDFAAAIGPRTIILPVLNGMKHVDVLIERFGAEAVGGCVCKVATALNDKQEVVQLAPFHYLGYGELSGELSTRSKEVDQFMQGAGFDAKLSSQIRLEMWEKWALLSTMGAITCLMRGSIGEIEAAPRGREFVHSVLDEVVAIIRAVGAPLGDKFVQDAAALLTTKGSPQASSMYRDLQGGHHIEADQIIGDLLIRAETVGIKAPLLAAAYVQLSIYQKRLNN
jgi:2-dehydropantoate 2-reductase